MMASYDQVKELTDSNIGEGRLSNCAAAAAAGFFCAFCSLPPDLLKTRLMNQKQLPSGEFPYSGVLDTVVKVWRNEGPLSFCIWMCSVLHKVCTPCHDHPYYKRRSDKTLRKKYL